MLHRQIVWKTNCRCRITCKSCRLHAVMPKISHDLPFLADVKSKPKMSELCTWLSSSCSNCWTNILAACLEYVMSCDSDKALDAVPICWLPTVIQVLKHGYLALLLICSSLHGSIYLYIYGCNFYSYLGKSCYVSMHAHIVHLCM